MRVLSCCHEMSFSPVIYSGFIDATGPDCDYGILNGLNVTQFAEPS